MTYSLCFMLPLQALDISAEVVNLAMCEPTSVEELPSRVPTDSARYHLFRFDHSYEGDRFNSIGAFSVLFSFDISYLSFLEKQFIFWWVLTLMRFLFSLLSLSIKRDL